MSASFKIPARIRFHDLFFLIVTLSLFEVFIGGGGRFFQIGSLTLRMYIFFFLLGMGTFYILMKGRIDKIILFLFYFFLLTIVVSTAFGMINNAELSYLFEDVKPLIYFMSILYLYPVVTPDNVPKIIRIIKISGFILAVVYCLLVISILTGTVNFIQFYNGISSYGEVMFRGENGLFFYKGFLYLNIAFFFYYLDSSKRSLIISIFIAATILLTLTRGFILSLGISMFLYYVFLNGNLVKKILFLLLTLLIVVLYLMYIMPNLGDRSISNTDRIIQMKQVFESTTLFTSLIGHGFGIGVPIRPGHMEISYLEIFHKQGLFGLSFWILLFVFIVFYYSKIRTSEHRYVADAFFLGTFFIYIQTFTNPFLNNPIGMTFVIITLLVFKTLYQQKKNDLRLHTGFQR